MFLQVGKDMEEQARVPRGWLRTYFRVWIPPLMTIIFIVTHSFVIAANTTSSIILLADRSTRTLSILALEFASPEIGMLEEASIISIFLIVLTVGIAGLAAIFRLASRGAAAASAERNCNGWPGHKHPAVSGRKTR